LKSFLAHPCRRKGKDPAALRDVLSTSTSADVCAVVEEWAKELITLSETEQAKPAVDEYDTDKEASRRQ